MDKPTETLPGLHKDVQMLREVLDGYPYTVVGNRFGISRSSVERRVKLVAVQLAGSVRIEGLPLHGAAVVTRLRQSRQAILDALDQFEPRARSPHRTSRVLTPAEVELGALRLKARAARPQHDLALYHMPFATGLRPLEVARLVVGDYLHEDGSVRRSSIVRAEVAINGKERPLHFCHRRLDDALFGYLAQRVQSGQGLGPDARSCSLDPGSPLFLGSQGEPYPITSSGNPRQRRSVCRPLLEIYRRIFRMADVSDLNTQSARLTLMSRMYERGADEQQVGLVLGVADLSALRGRLPRRPPDLCLVMTQTD